MSEDNTAKDLSAELSPVYGYIPQPTLIDFRGHLAVVFFLSGCNFRCRFCHNRTILLQSNNNITWDELEKACATFKDQWIDGVVITGGEPTLSKDLKRLIEFFRGYGLKIKLDTNGSNPDIMLDLIPLIDYVAVDVKCPLENYQELVGYDDQEKLNRTIEILKSGIIPYEFRTTVIEGYHTKEMMLKIRDLVEGADRYILQPFVPRDTVVDEKFRALPRTSDKFIKECEELFKGHVKELFA